MDVEQLLEDPRWQRVLEWELTAPASRQPQTADALAAEIGVSPRTVRGWKQDPVFQTAWRVAFQAVAGSLERTKALMDRLYEDGMDPENEKRTMAAKLFFDIQRAIAPPEPERAASRRAQELSDDELRLMLSQAALDELSGRAV